MNQRLFFGIVAIVFGIATFIALGGIGILKLLDPADPEAITLERQVEDLMARNAELKSQNEKYIVEIRDLNAQVQSSASAQSGGMATEEKRRALAVREAELDGMEQRLVQREERLRLDRTKLESEQRNFYNDRGLRVEEIGQAKEIKENQERMLSSLVQAEERAASAEELANNWLMAIWAISIVFVVGICGVSAK